jgi:hypothetical protein
MNSIKIFIANIFTNIVKTERKNQGMSSSVYCVEARAGAASIFLLGAEAV